MHENMLPKSETETPVAIAQPPDETRPPWNWFDVGAVVGMTAGGAVLLMAGANVLDPSEDATMTSPLIYGTAVLIYLLMLLGIYLFAARRSDWATLGWRSVPTMVWLAVPVLLFVGLTGMAVINLSIAALQGEAFENPQAEAITGGMALGELEFAALLVLIAGLVPVVEELFFRGMIYPLLRYRGGAILGVVGSAVLFALAHPNPLGEGWELFLLMPGLFFVGLILGLLRAWSGSVLPCILFHMLQNALALSAINAVLSTTT